jgi:acetoin utilization deacetylase AcuC-like enzyme
MTGLLADPIYRAHRCQPSEHPERPERFDAVAAAVATLPGLEPIESRAATDDELQLCHTPAYLRLAQHEIEAGQPYLSTGDTDVSRSSWDVAIRAAGGVLNAVEAVCSGHATNAFCAVRPPGHHATASRGMGFCILNNIALGARYAQRKYGVERVAIVDWDVHHGNGTQEIFYSDPSVFFFSTHQWPLYPGTGRADETGEGAGAGTTMNFPFPAGSGRKQILGAVWNSLMPAMERFHPDLVMISAGFDSRIGDLLGRFTLADDDFMDLTRAVKEVAGRSAGGRVVSVLEGGYSLDGLASAARAHVMALCE